MTLGGLELFDGHAVGEYGVEVRATLLLQVWDGTAELIRAAAAGNKALALSCLHPDDVLCRFSIACMLAGSFLLWLGVRERQNFASEVVFRKCNRFASMQIPNEGGFVHLCTFWPRGFGDSPHTQWCEAR